MRRSVHLVLLLGLYTNLTEVHCESMVLRLAENLEQFVTSTTLQWMPASQDDEEIPKYAVEASQQTTEDNGENSVVSQPIYVCRAKSLGVWVPGHVRLTSKTCLVSVYGKIEEMKQYEVLINIENSACLSWVKKDKYSYIQQGSVGSGDVELRTFVARKPIKNYENKNIMSHAVGFFSPEENFGVFHLIGENKKEIRTEEGEILVETEPIRYEFKNLKYNRLRSRFPKKKMVLGQAVLKNEEESLERVDTVISYNYSYYLNWGKAHGLITGLPYKVHLPNGSTVEGAWGLSVSMQKVEIAPVERYLQPGTGVNVTLIGNYTESEIPYTATVMAFFSNGQPHEFVIEDIKRENKMYEVGLLFGPEYFLHNNSYVPTTTTTSTTTTTTTTRTTSTTQHVTPLVLPPEKSMIEEVKKGSESTDTKHENSSMMSNDSDTRVAHSLKKKDQSHASRAHYTSFNLLSVLIPLLLLKTT